MECHHSVPSGQSHEQYLDDTFAVCAAPTGADRLLPTRFPTLKRGANDHCASGAIEIGTMLVSKMVHAITCCPLTPEPCPLIYR